MSTGWEGNPIKEAIAEQEEYITRTQSCGGRLGVTHAWETYSTAPGGPKYRACWHCKVTQTPEDYAIMMAAKS